MATPSISPNRDDQQLRLDRLIVFAFSVKSEHCTINKSDTVRPIQL